MRTLKNIYSEFIKIDDINNTLSFKIQNGPIKEGSVNGCQIDDIIYISELILEELNKEFKSEYNKKAINYLKLAQQELANRRKNRVNREVEGYSKE